jgi:hypothetical protein
LLLKKIAQTKEDPAAVFQLDGETAKCLEDEWERMKHEDHSCGRTKCEEEVSKLMAITRRNFQKIYPGYSK